MGKDRFQQKLHEQLQFLRNSAHLYDNGAEVEALRLATTMRVIFHDTSSSVSLMTHLQLKESEMLGSPRVKGDWRDLLVQHLDLKTSPPVWASPLLGNQFREVPIADWWEEEGIVTNDQRSFSRRSIVLCAANKDGGAHVDATLEQFYEVLRSGTPLLGITGQLKFDGPPAFPQGVTIRPMNMHLALIRQFAHDVIASSVHFEWC